MAFHHVNMSRPLDISANVALRAKHKLQQVMKERNDNQPLSGLLLMDDAYWRQEARWQKRPRCFRQNALCHCSYYQHTRSSANLVYEPCLYLHPARDCRVVRLISSKFSTIFLYCSFLKKLDHLFGIRHPHNKAYCHTVTKSSFFSRGKLPHDDKKFFFLRSTNVRAKVDSLSHLSEITTKWLQGETRQKRRADTTPIRRPRHSIWWSQVLFKPVLFPLRQQASTTCYRSSLSI